MLCEMHKHILLKHDDVIKGKHFPRYWSLVREVPGEFPTKKPVTRNYDVFFDLRMNKWLNKQQSWGWWFDTLSFPYVVTVMTLRPGQNGCQFSDDNFKCIFLNENIKASINTSLKFVPKIPVNNIPALFQKMAWR